LRILSSYLGKVLLTGKFSLKKGEKIINLIVGNQLLIFEEKVPKEKKIYLSIFISVCLLSTEKALPLFLKKKNTTLILYFVKSFLPSCNYILRNKKTRSGCIILKGQFEEIRTNLKGQFHVSFLTRTKRRSCL